MDANGKQKSQLNSTPHLFYKQVNDQCNASSELTSRQVKPRYTQSSHPEKLTAMHGSQNTIVSARAVQCCLHCYAVLCFCYASLFYSLTRSLICTPTRLLRFNLLSLHLDPNPNPSPDARQLIQVEGGDPDHDQDLASSTGPKLKLKHSQATWVFVQFR